MKGWCKRLKCMPKIALTLDLTLDVRIGVVTFDLEIWV